MHQSFIDQVVQEVCKGRASLEDIVFVLPSRRAGTFLKNSIAEQAKQTVFAPEIFSIESFVEYISGLSYATVTEQLITLYQAYLEVVEGDKESFYDFNKWARTLLADFDEIDRYLIPHHKVFSYLSDIKEIDHWYLQKEKTSLMEDYIRFWHSLEAMYTLFKDLMLAKGKGHQGLVYRTAFERISSYLEQHGDKVHVFLGFNALNEAESKIIQTILESTESEIFWDLDRYFIEESYHDAGYFIRKHEKEWKYYSKHQLKGLTNFYPLDKKITITGVPKNVSQAKYIGHIINNITSLNSKELQKTALVLGDESLLNPVLNALPSKIGNVNITMGYPLKNTPLATIFVQFFDLYLHRDSRGWYHERIIAFLELSYIQLLLTDEEHEAYSSLKSDIHHKNLLFLTPERLKAGLPQKAETLFTYENHNVFHFINNCLTLIQLIREKLEEEEKSIELEYLYSFYTIFNQLRETIGQYSFIKDIRTLQGLFIELLSQQSIDFRGEPLSGLQIMGMLESRVLDFETVIISSVNEGILPSGKQFNSFIPYSVKKELGLPTYKEKDSVYTYHFYRLLQRAQNIYLLYNTEPDVLIGGERSRLIQQMLTDSNINGYIKQELATMEIPSDISESTSVIKDSLLYKMIIDLAKRGFSPTSLTQYIRNPIEFYKRTILKIDDSPEVEETIAARTFGTIIHNALEELMQPFIGQYLQRDKLKSIKPRVREVVSKYFTQFYDKSSIHHGKNSIAFNVLIRNIENYIDAEIAELKHKKIKLIALEQKLEIPIEIPELPFKVVLKGTIDRVDVVDGRIRIIDYKTGRVNLPDMNVISWEDIVQDPDLNKSFQVMCYSLMYFEMFDTENLQAGVISFKNLKQGFIPFATKDKKSSRKRHSIIESETIDRFKSQLQTLIQEICNPEIPITEKIR